MAGLTLGCISKRLTEDVIDKYFKVKTKSNDNVKSITVSPAAAAGEGLISAVYRIQVKGSEHEASFVAKGLVKDPLLRKTLRCAMYFHREAFFLTKVLPLIVEVQKSTGAKENIQDYVPTCYSYYTGDDDDYILMEDLSEKNFASISGQPTIFERDLTLKTLSHMHAASIALKLNKPQEFSTIINNLPELYYNNFNREWYAQYLKNAIAINIKVLSEYEDTDSIYYKKFVALVDNVYDQLVDLTLYQGDHPVLNHGDAWTPNFLCSKERAVAIDFQLYRCASLVSDLTYFLTLCSNLCNKEEDYINAIKVYYSSLEYYLKDMGIDANEVYPWEVLMEELKKYGRFGLLASVTSIPLMFSERCDVHMKFADKYVGVERIPLEELWILCPIKEHKEKMFLVNAVRVAVDVGLI